MKILSYFFVKDYLRIKSDYVRDTLCILFKNKK